MKEVRGLMSKVTEMLARETTPVLVEGLFFCGEEGGGLSKLLFVQPEQNGKLEASSQRQGFSEPDGNSLAPR